MTVSVQETRFPHIANGVTVDFSFGCLIPTADDIVVTVDGVQVTSGFTVAGLGSASGGTVTFSVAPANGAVVVIERIIALKRSTDYQQTGDFLSKVVNQDFDRLWMAIQQYETLLGLQPGAISRVLKLGPTDESGAGAYRALQNRIQDLANPVDMQDAANKQWTLTQLAQNITDGAGNSLLQLLAASSGASLVGYQGRYSGMLAQSVRAALHDAVSIFRYIPEAEHAAIRNYTSTADYTTAFNAAISDGVKRLYVPAGKWILSGPIRTNHTKSYYLADTGLAVFGDGIGTQITQNKALSTDVVNYSSESIYQSQCVFAIHGSSNVFENLYFYDCVNPFYFGQDPRQPSDGTQDSHTSFNRFKNIWIRDCGTAFHSAVSQGFYYNTFEDIHMWQCQIGFHMRRGSRWATAVGNNNRNTFKNVRASRCFVGLFCENGDTNEFFGFHAENCAGTPTNNRYSFPSVATAAGIASSTGHYFGSEATNNFSFGCVMEANDVNLINSGIRNTFIGLYDDETTGKVVFNQKPSFYAARGALLTDYFGRFTNTRTDAYNGVTPGGFFVTERLIQQANKEFVQGTMRTIESQVDLGTVASGEVRTVTVQADDNSYLTNASGVLECELIANDNATNVPNVKRFSVLWKRNSSRTPTRYYVFGESNARATGANTGDATEAFTITAGISTKDITVTLTAPARAFAGAVMRIRDSRTAD